MNDADVGYSNYKRSVDPWIQKVPIHWLEVPVKHLSRVDNSGSYGEEPESQDITLPVATTAQIDSEGRFHVDRMPRRSFSQQEVLRYGCRPNDILIVKSSGSAANIISGKAGFVDETTPAFVYSNFLMRLAPNLEIVDPRFLYALIGSSVTRERVKRMVSTTTYPNLQVSEYVNAIAPLPPLDEQKQIAAFLDFQTAKIDTLIEKQLQLIALLGEKRQAVISHAVTKGLNPAAPMRDSGVEWLGEVPAHWNVSQLGHLTDEVTVGIVVTPAKYYVDSGVACLRSLNVRAGHLRRSDLVFISPQSNEFLAKSKIYAGDVVVVRTGQPGTAAVVDDYFHACNCIDLIVVRQTNKLDSHFLTYQMNSQHIQGQIVAVSGGAIQQHFNVGIAKKLKVLVPPVEEQTEIVEYLHRKASTFQNLICRAEEAVELLRERRAALISSAVTGKIDVRDWKNALSEVEHQSGMEVA